MSPDVSRRAVLRGAGVAGAAAAVTGASVTTAKAETVPLKASTFEPLVGKHFTFDVGHRHVPLTLHSLHPVGGRKHVHEDAFILRFTGPAAEIQGGQNGRLNLPGGATLTLFVVPGGPSGSGQEWIATVMNVGPHD